MALRRREMSETWLKENNLLLQHVTIPGYVHAFNNRDKIRGGGVGIYIKESIKFKRRQDLGKCYPTMEHLWIEIPGRNRYIKLLLGTICLIIYNHLTIYNLATVL